MAHRPQTHSEVCTAALILLALLLYLYPAVGVKMAGLCASVFTGEHCHHNQSGLCGFRKVNESLSCDHQLVHSEFTHDMDEAKYKCQVERIKDCGSFTPSYIYTDQKPLVRLRLYHYNTWLGQHSIVNFTFPSPEWTSLMFQYKVNNSNRGPFCLEFSLWDVSLPLVDTLMYDCSVFKVPGDSPRDAEVVFLNEGYEGRTFTFRIPSQNRIHPQKTKFQDWHVFFYLHYDFIATSSHLPVTVVSVPLFHNVSYNVSMVKCLDQQTPDCGQYASLHSKLVESPMDEEFTVKLPIWGNPGTYAVTVQMVSNFCNTMKGCYVSVSPKFEINSSYIGVWITGVMCFFLIAFLTFLFLFSQRVKRNKKILQSLKQVQPSVLLVYLANNQHNMEFINKFADFLKNTCLLHSYLVDRDVGNQDPNGWTREHIQSADKVLFIVPQNRLVESITPIRNQWIIALNFISSHHFTISNMSRKMAVVLLPSSESIPSEIIHVRCFSLLEQIGPLVTWLHGGTWLDEMFLWRPKLRWSSQEKALYSWSAVREVALKTSSGSTQGIPQTPKGSVMYKNVMHKSTGGDQTVGLREDTNSHSDDSTTTDDEVGSHASDTLLDPDIPRFETLQMDEEQSKVSVCSQESEDDADDDIDDGIFT